LSERLFWFLASKNFNVKSGKTKYSTNDLAPNLQGITQNWALGRRDQWLRHFLPFGPQHPIHKLTPTADATHNLNWHLTKKSQRSKLIATSSVWRLNFLNILWKRINTRNDVCTQFYRPASMETRWNCGAISTTITDKKKHAVKLQRPQDSPTSANSTLWLSR
jgi:hypothetical protein